MKKILIAGTAIAGMALMALPAFASTTCCPDRHDRDKCCPELNVVSSNQSDVDTINVAVSNSGLNLVNLYGDTNKSRHHDSDKGGFAVINTGATWAEAGVENDVGYNKTSVGAPTQGKVNIVSTNTSDVRTFNLAVSNSGLNKIDQNGKGVGIISSGGAGSSGTVLNMVGTNITEVK